MGQIQRAGYMDVSNSVDVSDSQQVADAVVSTLAARYPGYDLQPLAQLFADFTRLYEGNFPGFHGCDIDYHNSQHVLDVTLAMARLLDGHALCHELAEQFSQDQVLAGVTAALFHDSGYIRRRGDSRNSNGAAYTRVHVQRSARFMEEYLPTVGLQHLVGICTRIVYFTGYDVSPGTLEVADEKEQVLGCLLGTADLIAQMSDIDYVRKCRDYLYEEFVAGGLAGREGVHNHTYTDMIYRTPEQLLRKTPEFMRSAIDVRLDGYFNSVHRYAARHFHGRNLYMDAIQENCRALEALLAAERS